MLAALVATLLAASTGPIHVAAPGIKGVGIPADKAGLFTDYYAEKLGAGGGFRVVTAGDIAAVIGLERQKQLLGCADDNSSCIAELSGALGAEAIVTGTIARVGDNYVITVRIVDATSSNAVFADSGEVSSEPAVLAFLEESATRAAFELKERYRGIRRPVRRLAWIPAVAAGAAGIGGGVLFAMAKDSQRRLESVSTMSHPEALQLSQAGRTQQTVSAALLGGAIVGAAVATGMMVFGGPKEAAGSIAPSADGTGASLVFTGRFP